MNDQFDFKNLQKIKTRLENDIFSDGFCWFFKTKKGISFSNRYASVRINGKMMQAHRVSLAAFKFITDIPLNMDVDHLCKNTQCINPDHLEVVTHKVNMSRSIVAVKKYCKNGHEFTSVNTYIRPNKAGRACRKCKKIINEKIRKRKSK